jgi:hypothetical protein|nr:hypothetical protein [Neorhizobium tomejilense]
MRQEAYDLVEAVRSLGIEITGGAGPKALRIATDPDTFWSRLVHVKRALDAFDRAGGTGVDLQAPPPDEKLKKALDAILRLYEMQGGNMVQAANVIQDVWNVEPEPAPGEERKKKKGSGYISLPVFAPNGIKKKGTYSPRIKLIPDMPGSVSLDGLRRLGFDVSYVEAISGATLAGDPHERNRPQAARPHF